MFSEHFTGFISLRSKVWCSAELTIGFDSRYFVPLLHLPMASASKHCLWQVMGKGLFQEWSFCENNSMKNDSVEKLFWWSLLQIGEIKWMFVRIDACISEQPNSHFIRWCRIRQHHQNIPLHWRKFLSRLKARTICLISLCSFVRTTQIVLKLSLLSTKKQEHLLKTKIVEN